MNEDEIFIERQLCSLIENSLDFGSLISKNLISLPFFTFNTSDVIFLHDAPSFYDYVIKRTLDAKSIVISSMYIDDDDQSIQLVT